MGNAGRIQTKGTADAEMRQLDFGQRPIKFHDGFQQIDTFRNGIFDPIPNRRYRPLQGIPGTRPITLQNGGCSFDDSLDDIQCRLDVGRYQGKCLRCDIGYIVTPTLPDAFCKSNKCRNEFLQGRNDSTNLFLDGRPCSIHYGTKFLICVVKADKYCNQGRNGGNYQPNRAAQERKCSR